MNDFSIGDPTELKGGERATLDVTQKRGTFKDFKNNILNSYRSVTYSFTLAAIDIDSINTHSYKNEGLKYVVLKSGGKGSSGIDRPNSVSAAQQAAVDSLIYDKNDAKASRIRSAKALPTNQNLIDGFNKESPGRFDMFIDNVEIFGLMNFNTTMGTSLGTNLQFTVVEPHSIVGFLEALQAASVAAGYLNYVNAVFLLKIDFLGYPDNVEITNSTPKKIKDATRYIPFIFTEVGTEISQEGAKYSCKGLFYGDKSFGNANQLKQNISMSGKKVKDILEDLFKNINDQTIESDKKSKTDNFHDEYEIKFPESLPNGKLDFNKVNKIGKSDVFYLNRARANILYDMPDPGDPSIPQNTQNPTPQQLTQNLESFKYNPESKVKVQFLAGKNINECIEAVIVDSNYIRSIIDDVKNEKTEGGLIDYFLVQIFTEQKPQINPLTKTNYKKYTYVVTEYKMHFSTLPPFQTENWSTKDLKFYVLKQYDWFFTGQNLDVLSFRIKFDNLFYSAVPIAMANNDYDVRKNSITDVERKNEKIKEQKLSTNLVNEPTRRMVEPTATNPSHQGAATPVDYSDPYFILSRKIHDAVINSDVNGIEGDLEILGDPFFLTTSNNSSATKELTAGYDNITAEGAVDQTYGQMLIQINFKNPIDTGKFEEGGIMKFKNDDVSFSGIYRITEIKNTFRDGLFKQDLKVMRLPNQVNEKTQAKRTVVAASDVVISTVG